MGTARVGTVAAILGALIVAGGGPALAASDDPLVVSSTGLTEGQAVGVQSRFVPVWTGGADFAQLSVYLNGNLAYTTTNWKTGLRVPLTAAQNGADLLVTVRVYDSAGTSAQASTDVVVDKTYPTAVFSPAAGTREHGVFTVTASDVSDDVAEVAVVSPGNVKLATATAAPWTITYDSVGGPAGVHLAVTDWAGNVRTYTGYLIDNTAPGIGDLDFFGHPEGRVRGWTQLHVPFSDSSGINYDEWRLNGVVVQSAPAPPTPNSYYLDSLLTYDFGTTQRTVTLEVLARDRAGNESTKAFTVVVDATGPSITSVTPADGTLVRGAQIATAVRAEDPAGISGATLNWNWVDPSRFTTSIAAGADGRKTLTWMVDDGLDNATTVTRYVVVDNTRPILKITKAPKNGAKVKGTIKVNISATDRNGINRVELLINGKVVAKDVRAGYGFSVNTKKYGKKMQTRIRAYDRAGNVTNSATRTWRR